MKKRANPRSILIALTIFLAMGMGTAVFATEQVETDVVTTDQPTVERVVVKTIPEPEVLVSDYMMTRAEEELGNEQTLKKPRKSKLNNESKIVYEILLNTIKGIASGEERSTIIDVPLSEFMEIRSYTAEELEVEKLVDIETGKITEEAWTALSKTINVDFEKTLRALTSDFPYELYWYDKTDGCEYEMPNAFAMYDPTGANPENDYIKFADNAAISFKFSVSYDYMPEGVSDGYTVDTKLTSKTVKSAQNAAQIVEAADGRADYERLNTYKTEICKRVSYNDAAADDSTGTSYGDPWQMIWVFDEDPNTNVVCEGYSKAYKFLCDLTDFTNDALDCYLVSGSMGFWARVDGGEVYKQGPHMWNLVTMGEDENYLVDITNCDEPDGWTSDYFLKGDPNGDVEGYSVEGLDYS